MHVIHFAEGATDPLEEIASRDACFVQLAEESEEGHLDCLHLDAGGKLARRSIAQESALLTVHGSVTRIDDVGLHLELSSGVGVVRKANEHFALRSDQGGIMLLIQCKRLRVLASGISTPQRIAGQRWPGEDSAGGIGKM